MADINTTLSNLENIINGTCEEGGLPLAARESVFQYVKYIIERVRIHIEDVAGDDPYAHQNADKICEHIGAALGLAPTSGHSADWHWNRAAGGLSTLRSVLERLRPEP
jgi:hypothetical protein